MVLYVCKAYGINDSDSLADALAEGAFNDKRNRRRKRVQKTETNCTDDLQ